MVYALCTVQPREMYSVSYALWSMSILEVGPLLLGGCWVIYSELASERIKLLNLIVIITSLFNAISVIVIS